ncbi:hypothetical protein C8R44DRAFT_566046, partial [Mycena epipterygia]
TNNPPLGTQLAEIGESVRVAHLLKTSLEMQITETRMKLLRLEREHMHATRHIERCRHPLAPIRRIPTEILSNIFVCYADFVDDGPPFRDVRKAAWILGHICSYWRAVAISTPAVW